MNQVSLKNSDEWFNQFARNALVYRVMDEAMAGATDDTRIRAIACLGRQKDPRAVVTLMDCCRDKNPEIRVSAIDALDNIRSGRAVPTLVERVQDGCEELDIRCHAATALANIHTNLAVTILLDRVNDDEEDPALREYVAMLVSR